MIKETFNLICHSLKILAIYRHFDFQQLTHRHSVIRKMRLKLSAIYLLTRDTCNLIHLEGLECTSVHTPPVIILCQGNLLKVYVKSLVFRGLKDPVARQIVAIVARETRSDEATVGGVFYHPSTWRCVGGKKWWRAEREVFAKSSDPQWQLQGLGEKSNPLQRLHQHPPDWSWTQPAHLGVCTSPELRGGLVKNTEKHYRLRADAEKCTTRWAFSIRTRGVMWSSSN